MLNLGHECGHRISKGDLPTVSDLMSEHQGDEAAAPMERKPSGIRTA